MSKQDLVLPLGVGRLVLLDIGKLYSGHVSQLDKYFHVVKEVRYPTPVGYGIERQMKHPDTGENLIFELTVTEGKQGPWYVVRAFPESRDMTREEKAEGRSPTSVGNSIYEKMKIRSKVSGPVFFGWEVKEICYLFQQLEEGKLNTSFDHTKKNSFPFPPAVSRKREVSPSRSAAQRSPKKRRVNPEEEGGMNDSDEDLEADFAHQQQHSSSRRLRLAMEVEGGADQRTPGESSPFVDDLEARKRKRARKRTKEERDADEADRENQRMMAQVESQINENFEDGGRDLELESGEQPEGIRELVLSDADRLRKRRAEEKIRWVVSVEEKSKRRPKKRQEWKEKMEAKLKRLCNRPVTKAAEVRIAHKLKRLTKD